MLGYAGGMRVALLLAVLLAGAQLAWSQVGNGEPISGAELTERIEKGAAPLVLDVRTPEEFASGRVPGARNVPLTTLPERIDDLGDAREGEIVVYCERGGRAAKAESLLRDAGFTHVRHLEGDMSAWRAAKRPCEGC
jgi:rhodanese-related sulfurtransferase